MATDELTSISYTCGGSKGTVLVTEWYGTWEKLVLQGFKLCTYSICKVTFQNISLVPYKSMITMITMGEVKINRCWSKFVVLFIKACYFCFRNFQCST